MVELVIPYYVVQTFVLVDGELIAELPLDASTASEAANFALALKPYKAGVIAFEWSPEMRGGRYEPPYVVACFGQVPDECMAWLEVQEERTPRKRKLSFAGAVL